MSAPKVGDRVRVIAGQWTGWAGVVRDELTNGWLWVDLSLPRVLAPPFTRPLRVDEVEVVATEPENGPVSDSGGSGAPVEGHAANGAQNGGKR